MILCYVFLFLVDKVVLKYSIDISSCAAFAAEYLRGDSRLLLAAHLVITNFFTFSQGGSCSGLVYSHYS